jgi:heme-degrading monooxygenase HmoA
LVSVMNVVRVKEENREAFERTFLERESRLHQAEGFAGFELLRRDRGGEYVVLSKWETKADFTAYVNSDLFRLSHQHTSDEGALAEGSEVRHYEVIDHRVPA